MLSERSCVFDTPEPSPWPTHHSHTQGSGSPSPAPRPSVVSSQPWLLPFEKADIFTYLKGDAPCRHLPRFHQMCPDPRMPHTQQTASNTVSAKAQMFCEQNHSSFVIYSKYLSKVFFLIYFLSYSDFNIFWVFSFAYCSFMSEKKP